MGGDIRVLELRKGKAAWKNIATLPLWDSSIPKRLYTADLLLDQDGLSSGAVEDTKRTISLQICIRPGTLSDPAASDLHQLPTQAPVAEASAFIAILIISRKDFFPCMVGMQGSRSGESKTQQALSFELDDDRSWLGTL